MGHEPGVVLAAAYALNRQVCPHPKVVVDSQPPCNHGRTGQGEHTSGASSKAAPQARQMKHPHKKTKAPSPQTKTKTEENPWNPHTRTPPLLMLLTALFQAQSDMRRESSGQTQAHFQSIHEGL